MATCVGIGLSAAAGLLPASAPATPGKVAVVAIDRFGTSWYRGSPLDPDESRLVREMGPALPDRITVVYDPFCLEEDRDQLVDALRKAFPNRAIADRAAGDTDTDPLLRLPRHEPAVQGRIMACRSQLWDQLLNGHQQFVGQAQSYLTALAARWSRVRADLAAARQEYQPSAPRAPGDGRNP